MEAKAEAEADPPLAALPAAPRPPRRWPVLAAYVFLLVAAGLTAWMVLPRRVAPSGASVPATLAVHAYCTLLAGRADADHMVVTGLGSAAALAPVRAAFDRSHAAHRIWTVRIIPAGAAACLALDTLRRAAPPFGSPEPVLELRVPSDHPGGRLRDGERLRLEVTMAGFAGWLQVDYLTSDGVVSHMLPRGAGEQAMPPRRLQPGEQVTLFAPEGVFRGWEAGEPYGIDLILVTAAAAPLFDPPRPDDERAEDYLPALRAAVVASPRRSGWAVAVETVGK